MTNSTSPEIIHNDHWVQTPKGRLFARVWSAKEAKLNQQAKAPLVLFHDSLGCVALWRSFPARLCERTGRRVIAYDRLGYGKSDPGQHLQSFSFIQEEAEIYFSALRHQLGINEFIAFGHSVGGAMAVVCAVKFSDSCQALITESAQAFVEDRTIQGILEAKKAFMKPGQLDRLRKYHGSKAEWVLNAWTETWLAPEFATWSLEADLPQVKCPVLVVHGQDDEFGSARHPEMISRLVSGPSQIAILPDCRHVPHKEQEETIVQFAADFLKTTKRQ
jgi:pimeloyl-ACP methyl ester carboxylesterase